MLVRDSLFFLLSVSREPQISFNVDSTVYKCAQTISIWSCRCFFCILCCECDVVFIVVVVVVFLYILLFSMRILFLNIMLYVRCDIVYAYKYVCVCVCVCVGICVLFRDSTWRIQAFAGFMSRHLFIPKWFLSIIFFFFFVCSFILAHRFVMIKNIYVWALLLLLL